MHRKQRFTERCSVLLIYWVSSSSISDDTVSYVEYVNCEAQCPLPNQYISGHFFYKVFLAFQYVYEL